MDKKTFWKIIEEVNASVDTDDREAVLKGTINRLMECRPKEINEWKNILNFYHDLAEREHLCAAYAAMGYDGNHAEFEYFRSWLISKGHDVYMNVLHDPDMLAEINMPENAAAFEDYWYVAGYAYDKKRAYERLGEEKVSEEFEKWMQKEGKKLAEYYKGFQEPKFSQSFYLERKFIEEMSLEYRLDIAFVLNRPSEDTVEEIMEEIHLGEDISSDWTVDQLKEIVPRLYEKYNPVMQMQ